MLKERIGEVTRFELSSVMIRDMGSFTDIIFIGVQTDARITTSVKRNIFSMERPLKMNPYPDALYMRYEISVEIPRDGMNVTTKMMNSSQNAVENSILKSAPNVR